MILLHYKKHSKIKIFKDNLNFIQLYLPLCMINNAERILHFLFILLIPMGCQCGIFCIHCYCGQRYDCYRTAKIHTYLTKVPHTTLRKRYYCNHNTYAQKTYILYIRHNRTFYYCQSHNPRSINTFSSSFNFHLCLSFGMFVRISTACSGYDVLSQKGSLVTPSLLHKSF